METETKKVDPKRLLITFVIILATAGMVGGGIWYVMDKNAKSIQKSDDSSISALQKEINDLKKAATTTSTSTPSATTPTANTDPIRSFGNQKLVDAMNAYNGTNQPKAPTIVVNANDGINYYISTTTYSDLDGNGKEYVVVDLIMPGTGSYHDIYVLNLKDNEPNVVTVIKGQGHDHFTLTKTMLTDTYPIYKPGDPNCCPTGGNALDTYKWKGTTFAKQ